MGNAPGACVVHSASGFHHLERQAVRQRLDHRAGPQAAAVFVDLLPPPYSSTTSAVTDDAFVAMRTVAGMGYLVVLADRGTQDWRRPGVDAIVEAAMSPAVGGAVVMLYDGGGDRSRALSATRRLLAGWRDVRFLSVTEGTELPPAGRAGVSTRVRGAGMRCAAKRAALNTGIRASP
jgi:hypothetical protein